ncbi:lipin Ned1 [Linderina macrospora]|uniref:Lipin Ned1 n=1 Tax=Linderina macrospora TaxID=4868 RepID=A0ACC1JFV1_9FUNG|nr:lipin Ned1 [Linderina macrospora]
MSVVSDSAYVLDPFGASGTPPEVSDGATHTGWDWGVGVPAQKQAAVEDLPPVASNSVAATAAAAAASVIPQKTHSIDTSQMILAQGSSNKRPLSISLCGIESLQSAADAAAQEQVFAASLVDSAVFKRDAMGIITDPLAVFRTSDGKYSQSEPLVMSLIAQLAFGESLDGFNMAAPTGADAEGIVTIAESQREHKPDANDGTEGLKTSSKEAGEDRDAVEPAAAGVSDAATATETKPVGGRRWWQWGQRNTPALTITTAATNLPTSVVHAQTMPAPGGTDDKPVMPADAVSINIPPRRDIHSDGAADDYDDEEEEARFAQHTHYAKTLRLTSAQLKSLGLQRGANTVKFLVPSNKAYCEAKIFYYRHDTQIVISDIDGTITKSDALGHLFNMVGKDWTHTGVAKLYTDIARNGYEILYLTSRAIGQAAGTRVFLDTVKQGDYILPLGPLLLSPDRLFTSFHREVIMRRPHEFKMACLRDIKNLFDGASPFYAGFGNRITDAMSYRSVNVPVSRICTIDTSGEVKLELLPGYRSSYVKMNDLVDMMFPPLSSKLDPKFNDWEYWKTSLPSIDGDLAEIEAQLEAEKEAKRQEEERERLHKAALEDGRKSPSIFTRATRATRAASSVQPIDAVPPSLSPSQTAIGADSRARADSWAPPPPPQQLPPSPPVGASDSLEQTTVVQPPLVAVPTPQSGMALVQPIGIPPSRDTSSGSGRGDTTQRVSSMASNGSVSSNGNSRMSMLQKVNPFNLVRGSSPPAPANGINSNSGVEQSAFPQLKGSPPRTSELNNGGGSQLSLTDDPDVAAAASRLVPQFSKVSIESKNASDDEEYSDADDVDSEIDDSEIDDSEIDNDDDDEDDGDDEIDQETMNIIHDLDEIQYL